MPRKFRSLDGYAPAIGDSVAIITTNGQTGAFSTVNGLPIGNSKRCNVLYNAADVTPEIGF
ncbi:MAG: hypothetical protein R3A44_14760 [Caldilineaceae bacterium]